METITAAAAPYLTFGSGTTTLLFAHANAYPPGVYRRLLTQLGERYLVIAPQLRPLWDNSDPWQTLSDWHIIAEDLIAFCDAHDLRAVCAVGHSLGAVALTYAAVQRPELFERLVLIDPVFILTNGDTQGFSQLVAVGLRRRNRWPSRQAAFDHFRAKKVFSRMSDDALWDFVNRGLIESGDEVTLAFPHTWEARFYSLIPENVWQMLPQITVPTLAVRAQESDTLWPNAWTLWQQLQPQAQFVEVADAGHLLPLEKPDVVAQLITLNANR